MSDLRPVPVEDAVREGLAAADVTMYTCLFGVAADVVADESLPRAVEIAAEAVNDGGIVEVSVDVDDRGVRIRAAGDAELAADELPSTLRYVERLLGRYGGGLDVERVDDRETVVVLALVRAPTEE